MRVMRAHHVDSIRVVRLAGEGHNNTDFPSNLDQIGLNYDRFDVPLHCHTKPASEGSSIARQPPSPVPISADFGSYFFVTNLVSVTSVGRKVDGPLEEVGRLR